MKGIVFNLLAGAVSREHGEAMWDALLDAAQLTGAYTSLGSYPDAEMMRLVTVAAAKFGQTPDDVLRWFGRVSMPMLAERYGAFFVDHTRTRTFLLTLNDIIHPEVRKLYAGATPPVFEFDTTDPDLLRMRYRSVRQLCALAEGFIQGAADHFGERVTLEQSACMLRGDPSCCFELRFAPGDAVA